MKVGDVITRNHGINVKDVVQRAFAPRNLPAFSSLDISQVFAERAADSKGVGLVTEIDDAGRQIRIQWFKESKIDTWFYDSAIITENFSVDSRTDQKAFDATKVKSR